MADTTVPIHTKGKALYSWSRFGEGHYRLHAYGSDDLFGEAEKDGTCWTARAYRPEKGSWEAREVIEERSGFATLNEAKMWFEEKYLGDLVRAERERETERPEPKRRVAWRQRPVTEFLGHVVDKHENESETTRVYPIGDDYWMRGYVGPDEDTWFSHIEVSRKGDDGYIRTVKTIEADGFASEAAAKAWFSTRLQNKAALCDAIKAWRTDDRARWARYEREDAERRERRSAERKAAEGLLHSAFGVGGAR